MRGRDIDLSSMDLDKVAARLKAGDPDVLGVRLNEDGFCPEGGSKGSLDEFGGRYEAIEIDSRESNPHEFGKMSHSVLTREFRDQVEFPTRRAMDRVIDYHRGPLGVVTAT